LDDLSNDLRSNANQESEANWREASDANKAKETDRYGVKDWSGFVDFNEFDGGDGQMGVAGDGKKGLEKDWDKQAELVKSRTMSAKNAWGKSTGYAEDLVQKGVEATRAQQLENWMNQRELVQERNQQKYMTDEFDKVSSVEEDWRKLAKFGIERNQDFDMNQAFGPVVPGGMDQGTIELSGRLNQFQTFEFKIKNPFMGFSDFRAAFTPDTNINEWSVTPTEGSLNGRGAPVDFLVKFRPSTIGVSEGFLVVETEDDKWTWRLHGVGSM
jgi:hypothetical protein